MNDPATLKEELNKELDETQTHIRHVNSVQFHCILPNCNFGYIDDVNTIRTDIKESSGSQYKFVSPYTFELGAYSKNAEGKSGILLNWKDMQILMEIMAFRLIENNPRGKLTHLTNT